MYSRVKGALNPILKCVCGRGGGGSHTSLNNSQTPAGRLTVQLSSDPIYSESASVPES